MPTMTLFFATNELGKQPIEAESWDEVESELYDFANSGEWTITKEIYELTSTEARTWSSDWRGIKGPKGWMKKKNPEREDSRP